MQKPWIEWVKILEKMVISGDKLLSIILEGFVKTTISDLRYADYSEYFIGHAGSAYWRKKDSEKAEIFRKIEPYLTFLNVHQLQRQGADIQTKVEELEELNQSLRQRDKVKMTL